MATQQPVLTLTDLWSPNSPVGSLLYNVALVIGGSLLIALAAQVAIPLPFTPVPVTGQTLAVLLIGVLYGSRKGAATVMLYIGEGALGLPFFAGGKAGLLILGGATGGYLIGFILAAFATGWLAERGWDRKVSTAALAMMVGNAVIFTCGVLWLSAFLGFSMALTTGLLPFLPGMLIKLALAVLALPLGWKYLRPQTNYSSGG